VLKVTYDFYNGLENHTKALEIVTRILDQKKDDFLIWQQALYNASMLEDYDQIIRIGQEALKYFPNKDEVYLFLGMAWFQKKSYEDALRILEEKYDTQKLKGSIKLQYLVFLSQSAYYMNFKDKAYRYFDELISLDPKNNFIKNNYSYYLALDSTNLELAKKLSYETISEEPDNSTFLDTYAWILFKLGVYDEARVYAEKAVKINNHDPDIIFHYAEILRLMDLDALAEKYYKLAEEKGYDKAIIKSKLDRLITY
jgi:tetratricopeptide (TPR) repeat protein